jgi:hypothetical protein
VVSIPSVVPKQLVAGDTWRWTREYADYAAPTWTVTFYFENQDNSFSQAASGSSTTHSLTIAAGTTATRQAGRYRVSARATDGSVSETVESVWVDVLPNPAASGNRDTRTWARRVLDALEATIEGRASSDQLAVTISGRSISRIPFEELVKQCDYFRNKVKAEESGNTARGRYIKVGLSR